MRAVPAVPLTVRLTEPPVVPLKFVGLGGSACKLQAISKFSFWRLSFLRLYWVKRQVEPKRDKRTGLFHSGSAPPFAPRSHNVSTIPEQIGRASCRERV